MGMGTEDPGGHWVGRSPRHLVWLHFHESLVPCFMAASVPFFLPVIMNKVWLVVSSLVGLDAGKIKQVGIICGQESTRRIGDYKVKYGYTDIDLLR